MPSEDVAVIFDAVVFDDNNDEVVNEAVKDLLITGSAENIGGVLESMDGHNNPVNVVIMLLLWIDLL